MDNIFHMDNRDENAKGSSKIVIIFKRVHRVRWGEGVNGRCTLFINVDYDTLHMHTVLLKINE